MTPPAHVAFEAKKLFGAVGEIIDGSVACVLPGGGGPTERHTHEHSHLFIVTKGEAKALVGDETVIIRENEAYLLDGRLPHSVWGSADGETVMLGISVRPRGNGPADT